MILKGYLSVSETPIWPIIIHFSKNPFYQVCCEKLERALCIKIWMDHPSSCAVHYKLNSSVRHSFLLQEKHLIIDIELCMSYLSIYISSYFFNCVTLHKPTNLFVKVIFLFYYLIQLPASNSYQSPLELHMSKYEVFNHN